MSAPVKVTTVNFGSRRKLTINAETGEPIEWTTGGFYDGDIGRFDVKEWQTTFMRLLTDEPEADFTDLGYWTRDQRYVWAVGAWNKKRAG